VRLITASETVHSAGYVLRYWAPLGGLLV